MARAGILLPHPASTKNLRGWARKFLVDSGVEFIQKEIDWMIIAAADFSALSLITEPDIVLSDGATDTFLDYICRRAEGEPVQYILGFTEFYGLSFRVDSSVLIPRPETEGLVERAIQYVRLNPDHPVLDVGTGSGCIAIALAVHLSESTITAVDVSRDALEVAKSNGRLHGVEVAWHLADYHNPGVFDRLGGPFGLIVSNPPYVTIEEYEALGPEIRAHEPELALTPGEDIYGPYRQLSILASQQLVPGGLLLAEINEKLGSEICRILSEGGLIGVEVQTDLAGRDRYVLARKPS